MTAEREGSFGVLKQVDAGVLCIGYAEAGPGDGPAVILLHGWPYDVHSYADVTPLLASAGSRVIVPLPTRSSAGSTGGRGRLSSWPPFGPNGAGPSCRSAGT